MAAGDVATSTTVRLSLVRAPRKPDPEADQGLHRFTYCLVPGAGLEDTIAEGYALNLPLRLVRAGSGPCPEPLVQVVGADGGPTGATVEAVKLADDRSGDVVVRLYESGGGRASGRLLAGFPLASATATDLLERPLTDAPGYPVGRDGGVELTLRPFEILTLRLVPAAAAG